jgi:ribosomal RNA-processing protein 17
MGSEEEVEWEGIADELPVVDHEEEYVDEDKYTTVTVEEVEVSKAGLLKPTNDDSEDEAELVVKPVEKEKAKKVWPKKSRKEKFRYESKAERRASREKIKVKRKSQADARRGKD